MKIVSFLTTAALAALLSAPAFAQVQSTQRIDQRQANQQDRIHQGLRSGRLTPDEARLLQGELRRIQVAERRAAADGRITRSERQRIEQMQDRADARITHELRDRQRAHNSHYGYRDGYRPR